MGPTDLLEYVTRVLERLGVTYFVTGSVATAFFGEPRFTNDVDIVADLPPHLVDEFCRAFPPDDYYVSVEAARGAVARRDQFNIIHTVAGVKADIMVAKATEFDRSRLSRRMRVNPVPDYEAWFSSPEDVIVKKMDFYREGGSEKHLRDITGVLRMLGARVDRAYIADWASRLGLAEVWALVLARLAEPGEGRQTP